MNAATGFWIGYWLNIMLVLACDTFTGAIVAALAAVVCIGGFSYSQKET